MSAATMAKFYERLGHRVVQTPSCYWYDVHPWFYLNFPHHRTVEPSASELSAVFRRMPAGVRYFSPADAPGQPSHAFVIRDRGYDLDTLSANTRSKVRRGLGRCQMERLEPSYVRDHGRAIDEDTLRRIHVRERYPWDAYWKAVAESEGVEVWGALAGGELVAYTVSVLADRACEIQIARSSSEALRFYPNNALLFSVTRDMLSRSSIDEVFFGVQSLDAGEGIDSFKVSMGFEKSPIRQRVTLHPVVRLALGNPVVHRLIGTIAGRRPESEFWRKLRAVTDMTVEAPANVPGRTSVGLSRS
jgi:hypothetical protein